MNTEVLAKVCDVLIIDQWKAIFKFTLVFMTIMNNDLKLNIEGLSKYFRTNSNKNAISFEDLSRYFYLYKITNKE